MAKSKSLKSKKSSAKPVRRVQKPKPAVKARAKPSLGRPKPAKTKTPAVKSKGPAKAARGASKAKASSRPPVSAKKPAIKPPRKAADLRKPSSQKKKPTAARPPAKAIPPPKPIPRPKPKPRKPVFDAKTLRGIKEKLLEQQAELTEQLKEIEEAAFASSQSEISGEVGYDDQDYADSGSATFEREKDLSIANNVVDLLDKINKALEKIEEGSYGICESCGNPIELARLKALPNVLLCIKCKKAEERR